MVTAPDLARLLRCIWEAKPHSPRGLKASPVRPWNCISFLPQTLEISRRSALLGLGAALCAPSIASARASLRRTLDIRNAQTGESFKGTYFGDGYYEPEHIPGMAADLKIHGVTSSQLVKVVKSLNMGGVGSYRGSNFIHVDTGAVRSWRR